MRRAAGCAAAISWDKRGDRHATKAAAEKALFFLALVLFLLPIAVLPFYGAHYQELHGLPRIHNRVLDLSGLDADKVNWIPLNGEWNYSADVWLYTDTDSHPYSSSPIMIPTMWNTSGKGESFAPRYGYGTYTLTVRNFPQSGSWIVYLPNTDAAYRVYMNGVLVSSSGILSKQAARVLVDDEVIKTSLRCRRIRSRRSRSRPRRSIRRSSTERRS